MKEGKDERKGKGDRTENKGEIPLILLLEMLI